MPQASLQRESISSDEENETSLDVSCHSDSDGSTDSDTDSDIQTHLPSSRVDRHTAQVCTLVCILNNYCIQFLADYANGRACAAVLRPFVIVCNVMYCG